jgi:hypothetical protein
MSNDTIYPKVVVLCINAEGSPDFHTCAPSVTHAQMLAGEHYELAKENAKDNGFEEPMMAFDATDAAARQLADIQGWLTT